MPRIQASQSSELWLSLRFPQLSLDLLLQQRVPRQALVIAKNSEVYQACDKARALGINPGTSIHTALLLSETHSDQPDPAHQQAPLLIRRYCENQQRKALQQLAQMAYDFTPSVSLWQEQQSLLLELSGCLSLFGGLEQLLQKIRSELCNRRITAVASLAHSPRASWLLGWSKKDNLLNRDWQLQPLMQGNISAECLAHLQQMTLAELPRCPPFEQKRLRQWQAVGLKTLGDLFGLPRSSVARRYGEDCLRQLDKIRGAVPDLQAFIAPREDFFAERHFLAGLETHDMLRQPMQELLREFQQFLQRHQFQAESLDWRFCHFDKSRSHIAVELSNGNTRAHIFEELTQLQLAQHRIQSPIESVALYSGHLSRVQLHNRPLFSELGNHAAATAEASGLYDTLKSRLGQRGILQLQGCDEHLPEKRQLLTEPLAQPAELGAFQAAGISHSAALDKYLPLWLLSSPQPLSHQRRKNMTLLSSAHRIDSHWWQQRQQRDYFIAIDHAGRHWIYFDHVDKRWFIQGHYD